MNVPAVTRMLLRRGWLALLLAAAGGAAGLLVAVTQPEIHEATTRLAVRPMRPGDLGQTQAIREVMTSYMQDIGTLDMAAAVVVRLAGDTRCAPYSADAGSLLAHLRLGSDLNVYEIRIRARSRDQSEALCLSEKWAEAFVDRRDKANEKLDPLDRIVAAQRDDTTLERVWPPRRLLVIAAALLGLVAGLALVLAMEYVESDTVRDGEVAEGAVGVPVLAAIPRYAGKQQVLAPSVSRLMPSRARASRALRLTAPLLGLVLLGAATSWGLSATRPTTYRARTRIAVEPARGSDWGQTQAIREIMKGYSEDVRTRRMAARVNDELQLDKPPEELLARLNVAPKEDVYEIVVDVRGPDREQAISASRAWAQLFVEERTRANLDLDQRDRIMTRLRDQTVAEVWSPKRVPNTLAGAILGALVGAGALLSVRLLERGVVRNAAEAAAAAEAPLLAAIPSHRAGREQGEVS